MGGKGSGAKPKIYPTELVLNVRRLYESGMTQAEVGKAVGLSQRDVHKVMRRNGITARVAAKRNQAGAANHAWKGDAAGYQALHLRVANARGTPSKCARCGTTDPRCVYEWANLTGRYEDIEDYERMCRSCHRRYDVGRRW